jgi:hypothetical protein
MTETIAMIHHRETGSSTTKRPRFPIVRQSALALATAAVMAAGPASASRVFFDDFNSEAGGETAIFQTTLANFDVFGYIDIIAPDNPFGYLVDSTVIDIGGGLTGGAILTREWYRWEAGDTVTISFEISGNQLRPLNPDIPYMELQFLVEPDEYGSKFVDVERLWMTGWYESDSEEWWSDEWGTLRLGDYYFMYGTELAGDFPWTRQTLNFTPLLGGSVKFLFGTLSGGGYGPLIDNFAIDIVPASGVVPEPATWAMLIAGFGMVGMVSRQRRRRLPAG